nr:hypothetical protein [Tanacetum cinerariifolium]
KLKFIRQLANPIKDFKWFNVPGVKLSSFSKSDDTFSSLQRLSDLNYLFGGFMDYLWSRAYGSVDCLLNKLGRFRAIRFFIIVFDQEYKESLEKSSNKIASSNSNQENEGPPQDSDIRQLIREESCIEVCEEQKQNMEDTILELVEICRQKELYCMHDNVDDLIESALNFKLLSINSQRLNKEKQEVKNVVEQPAEHRTRIEKSLQNFRVIHKSSTSLNKTSQISSVHAVTPILSTKEPEYSLSMGYVEVLY